MAVTCEDFIIDIAHEQSFKYLQAKQFDHNSRKRRLIITDSNKPIQYSPTHSEYITLSLYNNGKNYSNTSCPFESDGYPYITFTESMLSEVGDIQCELRIYDHLEGTIITTFTFMMTISKSLLNHDRLIKSSEYDILNTLILQALAIRDMLNEYESNKLIIESYISQLNTDIKNYQNQFENLSNDAQSLIQNVQLFLNDSKQAELGRENAEKKRVEAENKRQKEMTDKINDIENRTVNALNQINAKIDETILNINKSIDDKILELDQYILTSLSDIDKKVKYYSEKYYLILQKAIMNNSDEISRIYDLIESLHNVNTGNINGGTSYDDDSEYINDYDGGLASSNNNNYQDILDGGGI